MNKSQSPCPHGADLGVYWKQVNEQVNKEISYGDKCYSERTSVQQRGGYLRRVLPDAADRVGEARSRVKDGLRG